MDQTLLAEKFAKIGANLKFIVLGERRRVMSSRLPVDIDVIQGRLGEEFEIEYNPDVDFDLSVLDLRPRDKHLLLMLKCPSEGNGSSSVEKVRFLCGHDERHYFVCGIPDDARVSTVRQAKLALLPEALVQAHTLRKGKPGDLLKRKNVTGLRQGEWLFVKVDNFEPRSTALIRRNEPISRGARSKPHICEELYAGGGETVYYHPRYAPSGVTESEMLVLRSELETTGVSIRGSFKLRTRDAEVYVRGYVRHPDHKTIVLHGWHRVLMNREAESKASVAIAFLD
jgi:hypothetical protein